mgnify:CR=1 FL=1
MSSTKVPRWRAVVEFFGYETEHLPSLHDRVGLAIETHPEWGFRVETIQVEPADEKHCRTCICGRRAPVQADQKRKKGPGTIAWTEHLLAWSGYAAKYETDQSAERIAERGGFGYEELVDFLGKEPETWQPTRE